MSDTVEYAVLRRSEGEEVLDYGTVTTDIGRARRARNCQQIDADFKEKNGIASPTACVLMMRTCTPWCEVADTTTKEKENG